MRQAVLAVLLGALCMAPSAPSFRIVEGGGILAGSVNGVPARIRVDPGVLATPFITADLAGRAKLRPSLLDFEYKVGPRAMVGNSAVGLIDSGTGPVKRRIAWTAALPQPGADGVIGPGMLEEDVVQFRLRASRAGERKAEFPLVDQGGLEGRWGERYALIRIDGTDVRIQFDPHGRETLATAQAGATVAAAHAGSWEGAVRQAPIAFGIARPVRTLALGRPLAIGPLSLARVAVRIHDFGSTDSIQDTVPDPHEIVVVADKKPRSPYRVVRLGGDVLERCSSITFDKRAKRVTISCL